MENGGITSIFHLSPRPSEHPYDHKYHKNRPDVGQYKAGQAYDAEKDAHYKKNHAKYYKACAQAHIPLTEIQKMNMAVSGIGVFLTVSLTAKGTPGTGACFPLLCRTGAVFILAVRTILRIICRIHNGSGNNPGASQAFCHFLFRTSL